MLGEVKFRNQLLDQRRAGLEQLVIERDRAGDAAGAARFRRLHAQQRDIVALVAMEGHFRRCLIAPHMRVRIVSTEILHVAEHMPLGVLRQGAAEAGADAPESNAGLRLVEIRNRQTADQDKPPPLQQLVVQRAQARVEAWQRKILARDIEDIEALFLHLRNGLTQLSRLLPRQFVNPLVALGEILGSPAGRIDQRFHRNGGFAHPWGRTKCHVMSPRFRSYDTIQDIRKVNSHSGLHGKAIAA